MTYIMTNIMTNIMINVMTAWKKVHSHSGQLSFSTPGPVCLTPGPVCLTPGPVCLTPGHVCLARDSLVLGPWFRVFGSGAANI